MTKRSNPFVAAFAGVSLLLSILPAKAVVVINAEETAGGVIFTGSGSINSAGLVGEFFSDFNDSRLSPSGSFFLSHTGGFLDIYLNLPLISGPTSFGSGGLSTSLIATGDTFGFDAGSSPGNVLIALPSIFLGYSGGPLSFTTTFSATDFATLGLTQGNYNWVFGTAGQNTDSVILNIGNVPDGGTVPDAGSTVALLGLAGVSIVALRRRMQA